MEESLNSLILLLSICHRVNDLPYPLAKGINKHFLGFSSVNLIQTLNATENRCKRQRGRLCLGDGWKIQNIEILFVLHRVLHIVVDMHSLNRCFCWHFIDKNNFYFFKNKCFLCALKLLTDNQWRVDFRSLTCSGDIFTLNQWTISTVSTDLYCDWNVWDSWPGLLEKQYVTEEQMSSSFEVTRLFRTQPSTLSLWVRRASQINWPHFPALTATREYS